jgi:hypothetical protein
MRAFDDEIAPIVAAFYLVHMLQLTGFDGAGTNEDIGTAAIRQCGIETQLQQLRVGGRCVSYSQR